MRGSRARKTKNEVDGQHQACGMNKNEVDGHEVDGQHQADMNKNEVDGQHQA